MENILRHFVDFDKMMMASPYGSGHINDTYKVSIEQGTAVKSYLLQRFNHQVFRQPGAVMENIRLVANHLSQQEYPFDILKPYPTRSGQMLHIDKVGNYWRLFDFFENTITYDKVENPSQAFEAAKAFGAFAKMLNGIDISSLKTTIPDFHNGEKRMKDFMAALKIAPPERLAVATSEITEVLSNRAIFKKINRLGLPLRATHHDTKINNVLFDKISNKATCVIDLDTVMPGIVLSDFGDMVRTFTNAVDEDEVDVSKIEMRAEVFEALSEGFLSEMSDQLTISEKDHLYLGGSWLTLMQAVRFLGDYLLGDVYYKTKYPAHNLVRAKNQLAMFRSIGNKLPIQK